MCVVLELSVQILIFCAYDFIILCVDKHGEMIE